MDSGHLYEELGFPVFEVPDKDVLAHGTTNPLADMATQAHLSAQVGSFPQRGIESASAGAWGTVFGELITFDDPEYRLPAIDRPESFRPGRSSRYRCVLVLVSVNGAPRARLGVHGRDHWHQGTSNRVRPLAGVAVGEET